MSNVPSQTSPEKAYRQFNEASLARPAPKPCYVTIRVTPDEKERLKRDAGALPLSAHVRDRVLGESSKPRRTRGRQPIRDHEALSRVLRALGKANLYNNLHVLMLAMTERRLAFDPALEKDLRETHRIVCRMREDLVNALGLSPRKPRPGRYAKPPGV